MNSTAVMPVPPALPPKLDRIYRQFLNNRKEKEEGDEEDEGTKKEENFPSLSRPKRRKRSGKKQTRRWKRGSDSMDVERDAANARVSGVGDDVPSHSILCNYDCPTVTKDKSSSIGGTDGNDDNDDRLQMAYQLLARTVVIPFSDHLISMVARPAFTNTVCNTQSQMHDCSLAPSTATTTTTTNSIAVGSSIQNSAMAPTPTVPTTDAQNVKETTKNQHKKVNEGVSVTNINRYKQSSQQIYRRTMSPILYQRNESLVSLVDGVISTLVQRRELTRRRLRLGISIGGRDGGGGDTVSSTTRASSGRGGGGKGEEGWWEKKKAKKPRGRDEYEQMCQVRNVLAEGYSLIGPTAIGGRGFSTGAISNRQPSSANNIYNNNSSKRHKLSHQTTVSHCENMAPGIQCTHPNSLASYARTSPLVRTLHKMIGDDLIRELLLHCIVLVPAGTMSMKEKNMTTCCATDMKDAGGTIDRGNYFQLCGPPLNAMKFIVGSTLNYDHGKEHSCSNIISPLIHLQSTGGDKGKHQRLEGKKNSTLETTTCASKIIRLGKRKRDNSIEMIGLSRSTASSKTNLCIGRQIDCEDSNRIDQSSSAGSTKGIVVGKLRRRPSGGIIVSKTSAGNLPWVVPRHQMFYCESYVKHVGFPPSHILNRLNSGGHDNDEGIKENGPSSMEEQLLNDIVHLHRHNFKTIQSRIVGHKRRRGNKRTKRWKRLRHGGIDVCKKLLQGHKKCDYARLLEHYCPLGVDCATTDCDESGESITKGGNGDCGGGGGRNFSNTLPQLVLRSCNSDQVKSFLSAVLNRVFPTAFWGSIHNFEVVLKAVGTFLNLRRTEQFPLKSITHGIRVLDIKWLFHSIVPDNDGSTNKTKNENHTSFSRRQKLSKSDHETATVLMQSQMHWLYCRFIIPLLRSSFYITETEFTGKRILHYRKPIWSSLKSLAIDELLQRQYTELSIPEMTSKWMSSSSSQNMGFSRLRLLPKKTGIRPIAVLCKRLNINIMDSLLAASEKNSKSIADQTQIKPRFQQLSTNAILRESFDVLKFERGLAPSKFGAGVFGCHEVYPRLLKFLKNFRSRLNPPKTRNLDSLYFASVDIYRCYDNIDQQHLYNLVSAIISEDEYLIQKHAIVHPFDGKNSKSRCKGRKVVGTPGCFVNFPTLVEELASHHSDSIILDGINCQLAKKDEILALIKEHLSNHIVVAKRRFGPQLLVQDTGIPQGR